MESQDRALRGTAATPELWGGAYMMLVFALLSRGLRAWQQMSGSPVASDQIVEVVIGMLLCPAPLIMGIAFRRLIKSELRKQQLNARTYKICNFWIAQLLILVYIAMVI